MIRLVVAMYLMIVAAAGPTACCCTLTRLTTRLASVGSPAATKSTSCCHTPVNKDSKGKPDERSPADRPDCPCKQGGGCEVVALPAPLDEALDSSARVASQFQFLSAILPDQALTLACASSASRGGSLPARGTSTDDLLYTFHMLRC